MNPSCYSFAGVRITMTNNIMSALSEAVVLSFAILTNAMFLVYARSQNKNVVTNDTFTLFIIQNNHNSGSFRQFQTV